MGSQTKNITVETNSGRTVTVEVNVEGGYDPNYGSDQDGNRGTEVHYINEISFDVPDGDDDGDILSQNEKNEVEKLIDEEINNRDWDLSGDPEDYDNDGDEEIG